MTSARIFDETRKLGFRSKRDNGCVRERVSGDDGVMISTRGGSSGAGDNGRERVSALCLTVLLFAHHHHHHHHRRRRRLAGLAVQSTVDYSLLRIALFFFTSVEKR